MSNTVQGTSGISGQESQVLPPQMSIAEILLMIGIQAMDANDQKIRIAYEKVKQNNEDLQKLNKAMAYLAAHKDKELDPNADIGDGLKLKDVLDRFKISRPANDGKIAANQFARVETAIKGASDALGGTNQIDMMKLQSVLNKQNEMSQMVSNNMSKLNQMAMALIGNMR
ncbi:hypothetical protein [Imhoffiella purpurea]|uniref:Uncharacterized protein n=1 Tax=Imhoffiella purpurea TaxID=1249627 RepID=W9VZ27_9GAMM|nr:hypothetical protein [Imhoffiella purpurea]EXJ15655.1 hypothetical protein D779_1162 [Imhoffiella purpurea]